MTQTFYFTIDIFSFAFKIVIIMIKICFLEIYVIHFPQTFSEYSLHISYQTAKKKNWGQHINDWVK